MIENNSLPDAPIRLATGDGALPCKSQVAGWSWQANLGRQGGYCASIIPLHPLIILLLSPYYPLIILLLSSYYPLIILLHGVI